jgi:hypothetical protein
MQFYFITNFKKDILQKLTLNSDNKQIFLLNQFTKGRYIIKLDWSDGTKDYYQEIDINL